MVAIGKDHVERARRRRRAGGERAQIENLWARISGLGRIRPRDALLLRRLGVEPFDGVVVYELDAEGYVVGIGWPEELTPVDIDALRARLEERYGTPSASLALSRAC